MKQQKNVAFVVLNYIQFYNVKIIIDALIKRQIPVDIYVPEGKTEDGFDKMFDDVYTYIKKLGYSVSRQYDEKEYKIVLEPYPFFHINAQYRMKYKYGILSAKPNPVYEPSQLLLYDVIFCNGKYEQNYMSVFSKAVIAPNVKFFKFKRKKHVGKPILLYLPTYGLESSLDIISEAFKTLKKEYQIVIKFHHGTQFLNNEKDRLKNMENIFDKVYDSHTELASLLETADIVLSDNSGSIFEALYTHIPVAIFTDQLNVNKKEGFNTTQYELVQEGIIPYTDQVSEISNVLRQAQTKECKKRQKEKAIEMFYYSDDITGEYMKVIESYLDDTYDHRYYEMHQILKKDYYALHDNYFQTASINAQLIEEKERLIAELDQKQKKLQANIDASNQLKRELKYYQNGKLYGLAHKMYELKEKVERKK